ncbi:MAG TPA: MBL fold metallo-hydrolase RNA specificity domain-containing protein, partial [Desulfobacterales bacterium]|nr:MBL fold metallo-hydrolase RNA specificity domain-containing protein [Desulfobacterales bacterium]
TGDLGRFGMPILRDPTLAFAPEDAALDLLIMESTYGQRRHSAVADLKSALQDALQDAIARGGVVLIPSFAYGRAQVLLYMLHLLYDEGALPRLPIYLDSPLGTKMTQVYAEHPEVYDREANEVFLANGKNPFAFHHVNFVASVEESMALMRDTRPAIVIAASGMCEAGRILHHLRYKIHDPRNTILIVGFMAENTLGRRILELGRAYEAAGRSGPAPVVRVLNKEYPLRARVVKLDGFSAHGDRDEMLRFVRASNLKIRRIALVHGEEAQSLAFAATLRAEGFDAFVPHVGESVRL